MKDCYAVHLIRWFNELPESDLRPFWKRFWHRIRNIKYVTKTEFYTFNQNNLARHIVDNRQVWTNKDIGYE